MPDIEKQEELDIAYTSFVSATCTNSSNIIIKARADRLRKAIASLVPIDECECECNGNQHMFDDGSKCQCICHPDSRPITRETLEEQGFR
jgi:hypothetical protein